ncbi:hypothetical protein SLEP1_g36855 [Rubroshorea leprosula]|uniref:DUF659 domain-containing protein n=1 Tax=Rubroshorea leprosula TaxID=152421 RepID=A0AAV5KT42_9ROSI|nr:hypothetical protein SLEP1_g36855 [Rubroshorea leprosula]
MMCNFCNKVTTGGITRAKRHQIGIKGDVAACPSCPQMVRDELFANLQKKNLEKDMLSGGNSSFDDDFGFGDDEEEVELRELPRGFVGSSLSIGGSKNKKATTTGRAKGPMDLFMYQKPEAVLEKRKLKHDKGRQLNMKEYDKEMRPLTIQYIARFFYENGIAFNVARSTSFKKMVEAIGQYGPNLRPPSYHELRVSCLNKELEHTKKLLEYHKSQWTRYGVTLMSDGWTDRKQRSIINFLVNSPAGTMFIKSIDASSFVKTGEKLFELIDGVVEEIGAENVIQLVTNNGSNYVAAGKLLEEKRKHIFWTPCAAHCIDLMLEDIGKISKVKRTIQRAMSLVGFIYNHSSTLNLMRQFTNNTELVRHGLAKDSKGVKAMQTVMAATFWNGVLHALKVMGPLVSVLRLVDSEKKPAMPYIYEAMGKAKDAIKRSLNEDASKYNEILDIIDRRWECQLYRPLHAAAYYLNPATFYGTPNMDLDLRLTGGLMECIKKMEPDMEMQLKIYEEVAIYNRGQGRFGEELAIASRASKAPVEWWTLFGHSAPNLQKLAIKILSLTCSASGCERNWSVFEQIHSKKRNRLEHQKMHDLVFIKYNQALKARYDLRDEIDPISLSDVNYENEWLIGEMDKDNNEDAENDLVFPNENLTWGDVERASGATEIRTYTRGQARKNAIPTPTFRTPITTSRSRVVEEVANLNFEKSDEEEEFETSAGEKGQVDDNDDYEAEEEEMEAEGSDFDY